MPGRKEKSVIKNWWFWIGIIERIIIITVGIWTIFNSDLPNIKTKGLAFRQIIYIVLIFIIPYLAIRKKLTINEFPFKIDAIILSPLFLDTIGNFSTHFMLSYDRWDFFDKIAHFWGSGVFTFLAFTILILYFYSKNEDLEVFYFFWTSAIIGIVLEGFWEVFEYYSDFKHGTILVGGIGDTIGDVIGSSLGSLVFSGICSFLYLNAEPQTKNKYLLTLSRLFINKPERKEKTKNKEELEATRKTQDT